MGNSGSDNTPRNWPKSKSPDLAKCRAKLAGFENYTDCLVKFGAVCEHAMSFGHGYFCRHPERDQIIARTKAENEAGAA